jgi:hypothetical protein
MAGAVVMPQSEDGDLVVPRYYEWHRIPSSGTTIFLCAALSVGTRTDRVVRSGISGDER